MVHLAVFALVARCFVKQQFPFETISGRWRWINSWAAWTAPSNANSFWLDFVGGKVRQSGHARVKMPPHYCSTLARSMFAEWGLNQSEYSSRGVPSKPWPSFARSRATMSHAQV